MLTWQHADLSFSTYEVLYLGTAPDTTCNHWDLELGPDLQHTVCNLRRAMPPVRFQYRVPSIVPATLSPQSFS